MSGVSKRSHEETVHSSSKQPHEDAGTYSKLSSSISNEYHISYDIGQDSRVVKAPRTESRDSDRRSPLHSLYRVPSSSNDTHVNHPVAAENRVESRDSKDSRDLRLESRDAKTEKKELHGEARRDSQSARSEKDVRIEGRGDESKDSRYGKDSHHDLKGDFKTEKDGYSLLSSYLNWKELKESNRGKRYSDAPSASLDSWHVSRSNTQVPLEAGKEGSTAEKDYLETQEAVGENKDVKGEDRLKEKDRKRKDVKHRDWGEREKSDRRSGIPVANTSGEGKDSAKEEKDVPRLERERRDLPKDKEGLKEREKDHMKRESWNGPVKEVPNNEKEPGDGSVKRPEQENVLLEQKKPKDHDSWKNVDRETRERKIERDADLEGDRPDKRSRCIDKELDDGFTDGDGATEKEKEVYNNGVLHRKRVQRSRGSPQVANREPRFRSHALENEGYFLFLALLVVN